MHQTEKRDEHRPPRACQHTHAPNGKYTDQRVCNDAPQRVPPFSAERGQQADQRQLRIQVRREHGAQHAEEQQRQLCAGVEVQ